MFAALQSLLYLAAGYVLIFAGIAFSNKQLLPSMFDDVYMGTSYALRVFIFTIVFALPANYLIPKAFQFSSAAVAGPLLMATVLVVTIIFAMIVDKVQMTLPIIGVASAAMFFCCLTAWLLEAQRLSS